MQQIPLSAIASQTTSFNVDGAYWTIKVYPAITQMVADVSRDGETLISGVRCFAGIPLLPFRYLSGSAFGNFIFDQDADWEEFGSEGTCNLWYLTSDEMENYNALIKQGYSDVAYNAAD